MAESLGERVRKLRDALKLTQAAAAEKSSGLLRPEAIAKIEGGTNKASSATVRRGLAEAFDVLPRILERYLEGSVDLEEFLKDRERWQNSVMGIHSGEPDRSNPLREQSPSQIIAATLIKTLIKSADPVRNEMGDLEFVKQIIEASPGVFLGRLTDADPDAVDLKKDWLEGCIALREAGLPLTLQNLMSMVGLTARRPR